ncbi:YLR126C [Saccharomyces arboricola H-6]|uniref:YLR126C n=1 Tax=Saccharomyces arboricola (strain H-6 / AS 2.3317 / CBS 10644) TaxID=1160507 RepID=J8LKY5_SACAR|nr:YLR126C [Saccharomyces arboricola H-6]
MTVRKIAILYTDEDNEWSKPWGNFVDMAIRLLEQSKKLECVEEDVEYEIFHVQNGEFPQLSELQKDEYLGMYITGSKYDSFDNKIEWIIKLRNFMKEILTSESGHLPVAGVCFGHQVMAAALGSSVGRNPKGFEGGVVSLRLNSVGQELFGGEELNLSEVHSDCVFNIPEGYQNWASSDKCQNQGFYRKNKVLTFQGHPEFTNEVAQKGLLKSQDKLNLEEFNRYDKQCQELNNDGIRAARNIWKLFLQKV